MSKRVIFVIRFLHLMGMAAFLGSVFSITTIARINDFSGDWARAFAARTDIMHIIEKVTYPGLGIMVISGILLIINRRQILKQAKLRLKLVLVVMLILNTVFIVVPAAEHLRVLADQAQTYPESASDFNNDHLTEDIFGILNLILFFIITVIGLRFSARKM